MNETLACCAILTFEQIPGAYPAIDNSIEFWIQLNLFPYSIKKTDPITMKFCTFQESCVILECVDFFVIKWM